MGSTAIKVLGSAIVSDYVRNGDVIGFRVEIFDSSEEFVSQRIVLKKNESDVALLAAGSAFATVMNQGWWVRTTDYTQTVMPDTCGIHDNGWVWRYVFTDRGDFGRK